MGVLTQLHWAPGDAWRGMETRGQVGHPQMVLILLPEAN